MLVIFTLLGTDKSNKCGFKFFAAPKYIEMLPSVIYEMDAVLGKFIHGQIIEAFL
jgi:predicted PurR-regulated permease PerM